MKRKLVSFVLLSYNQEEFIEESLLSALNQDYPNIQLIVSDDASSDTTPDIINNLNNSYEFKFIKNKNNLGLIGNLNLALSHAQGEYIVVMAGDDISEINRVSEIVKAFDSDSNVYALYSGTKDIDLKGNVIQESNYGQIYNKKNKEMTLDNFIFNDLGILGCSAAYRRIVIENPLPSCAFSEDKVLTCRALRLGKVEYIDEKLVHYRLGSGISNNTGIKSQGEYKKSIFAKLATISAFKEDGLEGYDFYLSQAKGFYSNCLKYFNGENISLISLFLYKNIKLKEKLRLAYYLVR